MEAELTKDAFCMRLDAQLPQSQDLNVLYLGFFHSLERRAVELTAGTILGHLMTAVDRAFKEYDAPTLDRVWRALQRAMSWVVDCGGGSDFPVPHAAAEGAGSAGGDCRSAPINRRNLPRARFILGDDAGSRLVRFSWFGDRS